MPCAQATQTIANGVGFIRPVSDAFDSCKRSLAYEAGLPGRMQTSNDSGWPQDRERAGVLGRMQVREREGKLTIR